MFVSGAQDTIQLQTAETTSVIPDSSVPHNEMEGRLERLKRLFDKGLITGADYDTKRREILREL